MSEASPHNWPASLSADLIAELKTSGINASVAARMGVHGIHDARAAGKLVGGAVKDWEANRLPALVYPYFAPGQRDPVAWRAKPRKPFEYVNSKTNKTELAKYTQKANTGTHIYLGPSLVFGEVAQNNAIPILISEGEKKTLAGESAGFPCIGLSGVHQWHVKGKRVLHPTFGWVELRDREVFICFDHDALTNADVRKQELELGRALAARGAKVYIVRFPPEAPKLDDFLATHPREDLLVLLDDARTRGALPVDTRSAERNSEEWKELLEKLRVDPETGAPVCDVDVIAAILRAHPAWEGVFAWDARRERQLFLKEPPFDTDIALKKTRVPRPVEDSDRIRIACWLVAQGALGWTRTPKPNQIEDAISIATERNRYDGVAEYFKNIGPWDGTARLDAMGPTYFAADDTPYVRTVFAKWMLSAVARTRQPGCKADHILVLEGAQGIRKSTALRVLAGDEYFADSLPKNLNRDAHEYILGPWIVELAELEHMRKGERNELKAFATMQDAKMRLAYGRRTREHKRRCIFAGTTNDSEWLDDPTGGRRWWPVYCHRQIDTDGLARDRDQLWAEAFARVKAGEKWHIEDADVLNAAREEQAARRMVDPWLPTIQRFVRGRKTVTVGDVLDCLGAAGEQPSPGYESYQRPQSHPTTKGGRVWQYDQRSSQRIANILRDLGWVRRRLSVDGDRVWGYVQDEPAIARPSSREGGTGVGQGQPRESSGHGPPVPPVPANPVNTRVGAREAPTGQLRLDDSVADQRSKKLDGSPGTGGSKVEESGTYPCPTPVPPSTEGGTGAEKPKGRRA